MKSIYDLGEALPLRYTMETMDASLKFTLFPYKASTIINTSLLLFLGSALIGMVLEQVFTAEILFTTCVFFGLIAAAITYIYPVHIYKLTRIMEYKQEMLNTIMRFTTYLSMKSNMEHALYNSLANTKGILRVQFQDILLRLERKEYINLGEAFREYSTIWNQYSPEFVDSLKLLEVAALSSGREAEEIMEESISQIMLTYNIEQKRQSELLSESISKVITIGIMFPVMFLMLVPMVSVFLPDFIKASILFFGFNILLPAFLFVGTLNFAAKRLQLSSIDISSAKEYKPLTKLHYIIGGVVLLLFLVPSTIYLIQHDPSHVSYDSFNLATVFYVWLIPAGVSLSIFILGSMYCRRNRALYENYRQVEEDLPHLLNYFSTYLTLSVPMENIFKEVTNDYTRHGFQKHPSVALLNEISFKLAHLKTNLKSFIKIDLKKISSILSFNEILEQIVAFGEFSLKEASKVAKKIRSQRVEIVKLNDYILTMLNPSLGLISTTISMLAPLLSALAIIMSLFVVQFIKFLSEQLETIANLGNAGQRITLELINIEEIISPVYLELIIGFYLVEIIIILGMMKATIKDGYSVFKIVEAIKGSQLGFIIFTLCLFGGYYVFMTMFKSTLGISL
ncbi:MAG: hypothetical protein H6500_05720 [Candidatus Woesearchaeota archaeon]|nr:MAG: hypothetical protein H6500_05720 [Candidatus Woesearchaeota archaeon]